jgi:hypothetical protein
MVANHQYLPNTITPLNVHVKLEIAASKNQGKQKRRKAKPDENREGERKSITPEQGMMEWQRGKNWRGRKKPTLYN